MTIWNSAPIEVHRNDTGTGHPSGGGVQRLTAIGILIPIEVHRNDIGTGPVTLRAEEFSD